MILALAPNGLFKSAIVASVAGITGALVLEVQSMGSAYGTAGKQ